MPFSPQCPQGRQCLAPPTSLHRLPRARNSPARLRRCLPGRAALPRGLSAGRSPPGALHITYRGTRARTHTGARVTLQSDPPAAAPETPSPHTHTSRHVRCAGALLARASARAARIPALRARYTRAALPLHAHPSHADGPRPLTLTLRPAGGQEQAGGAGRGGLAGRSGVCAGPAACEEAPAAALYKDFPPRAGACARTGGGSAGARPLPRATPCRAAPRLAGPGRGRCGSVGTRQLCPGAGPQDQSCREGVLRQGVEGGSGSMQARTPQSQALAPSG